MSATNPFAIPSQASSTGAASPFTNGAASASAVPDEALAGAPTETAKPVIAEVDLNDPLLTAETLTAKEGDAFAEPPPPPDRLYRVQLKLRGVSKDDWHGNLEKYAAGAERAAWVPEQILDKKTQQVVGVMAKTIMDVQIHDPNYPEYEGVFLQVPFKWIDTRPGRNNGPSKMMSILNILRQPSGQPWITIGKNYGPADIANTFVKALAGEPEVRCRSEWNWVCRTCGEIARDSGGKVKYPNPIEGMNKFNQIAGKPGVYNHELRCQAVPAHGFSKAWAVAAQYFALDGTGK